MTTNANSAPSATEDLRDAANSAAESARAYAQNAVDATGQKVRSMRGALEPTVEQIASRVQQAVQRGLDAATKTGARAQQRIGDAADVTTRYISDQPMRSVLFAAAAGAAIAALLTLALRRDED